VNNQYRGRDAETYRAEFVDLLEQAIAFAGNHPAQVLVLSIPDWGVTPFARGRSNVSAEIDAFNAANRAETLRLGAQYLDLTPGSRRARDDATLLARDGLHPSAKMYDAWVEQLLPFALDILREPAG
jgi:lysophospholipase L1-like esterase